MMVTSDAHVTNPVQSQLWHLRTWLRPTINTTRLQQPPSTLPYSLCAHHARFQSRSAPATITTTTNPMISSGFTNAPVSQFLVFSTVIGALLATLTDTRYYLHIQVVPHIWGYGQFWRFLTWQVCFFFLVLEGYV